MNFEILSYDTTNQRKMLVYRLLLLLEEHYLTTYRSLFGIFSGGK